MRPTLILALLLAVPALAQGPVTLKRPVDPGYKPRLTELRDRLKLLKEQPEHPDFALARKQPGWKAARELVLDLTENDTERLARGMTLEWRTEKLNHRKKRALRSWESARGGAGKSGIGRIITGMKNGKPVLGAVISEPYNRPWLYILAAPSLGEKPGTDLLLQMATLRRPDARMPMSPAISPTLRLFYGKTPVEKLHRSK